MKKGRTLLFRVGILTAVFFSVLIVVIGTVVYAGTTNIFLNAKNEMIDRDLLRVKKMVDDIPMISTFIEYWKEHPHRMRGELTDQEYETGGEAYGIMKDAPTPDVFWSLSETQKLVVGHDFYNYLSYNFNEEQFSFRYAGIYLVDITEKNCGYVICRGNGEVLNDRSSLGSEMQIDITGHNAVKRLRSGDYASTLYEIVDDPGGNSYYVGYAPVEADGSAKYAVCMLYDWAPFKKVLSDNLFAMLIVGILIMTAGGSLLLHFLARTAIKPVTAIQRCVRRYIGDKDSKAVVDSMKMITEENEFGALAGDISQLAEEMERYTDENIRLAGEHQRVATELDLAARIQNGSLPSSFPAYPERGEFDIYASMTPAKEVGGDFYDYFLIDDDHLALVIADVSGKGVPASLFMMSSKILISNRAVLGGTPAEIFEFVNERICENNTLDMFVTVWLGILEISTGKLTCSNAGHEFPIFGKNGKFELMKDKHCMVLGAVPGIKYKNYEVQLEKGETVFVYTDGAAEATDASENMFGTDRITEALNTVPDGSPKELIDAVAKAVDGFVKDAPQFDDLTMLALRYIG